MDNGESATAGKGLTKEEQLRREAATYYLMGQIGTTRPGEEKWFSYLTPPELGGRTLTAAWMDGDIEAVRQVILGWYADTDAVIGRQRKDPNFRAFLEEKIREADERIASRQRLQHSA